MMIKNIVFDMGNVLLDYDPARIVRKIIPDAADAGQIFKALFQSRGWQLLDLGLITFDEHYQNIVKQSPRYSREIQWILNNWYTDQPLVPGIEDIVAVLRNAGFPLYILSNANLQFYTYAPKKAVFKQFCGITISADLHLIKPQREIYEKFCQIHNLNPAACLFIDNMLENVDAAIDTGWQAIQFMDSRRLRGDLEELLMRKLF
jgi:putative hydrolase of the HAD superfamily